MTHPSICASFCRKIVVQRGTERTQKKNIPHARPQPPQPKGDRSCTRVATQVRTHHCHVPRRKQRGSHGPSWYTSPPVHECGCGCGPVWVWAWAWAWPQLVHYPPVHTAPLISGSAVPLISGPPERLSSSGSFNCSSRTIHRFSDGEVVDLLLFTSTCNDPEPFLKCPEQTSDAPKYIAWRTLLTDPFKRPISCRVLCGGQAGAGGKPDRSSYTQP